MGETLIQYVVPWLRGTPAIERNPEWSMAPLSYSLDSCLQQKPELLHRIDRSPHSHTLLGALTHSSARL